MRITQILMLLVAIWCVTAGITTADEPSTARQQYDELAKKYEQLGGAEQLAGQFLRLARQNPGQPVAIDSLGWILINVRKGDAPAEAVELLLGKYHGSERLGEICTKLVETPSLEAERFLREVLDKTPHRKVRAAACYSLAAHLQQQLNVAKAVRARPRFLQRFEQFYGKEYTAHLTDLDSDEVSAEVEQLYDRVVESFAGADPQWTEAAKKQLVEIRHLSVGKPAMEIEGRDAEGVHFKLSDYRGKIVMLSFWGHW